MSIRSEAESSGIVTITVDAPPVNALPVTGWFELARALDDAGRDETSRVVILRAEGRAQALTLARLSRAAAATRSAVMPNSW